MSCFPPYLVRFFHSSQAKCLNVHVFSLATAHLHFKNAYPFPTFQIARNISKKKKMRLEPWTQGPSMNSYDAFLPQPNFVTHQNTLGPLHLVHPSYCTCSHQGQPILNQMGRPDMSVLEPKRSESRNAHKNMRVLEETSSIELLSFSSIQHVLDNVVDNNA